MSAVSSLAIICFAGKCQVQSRLLSLAKSGWEDHPAQDSVRWAKGECWQSSMTPDKTYRDICAENVALFCNKIF